MKIKINKRAIYQYFLLYLVLIASGSFLSQTYEFPVVLAVFIFAMLPIILRKVTIPTRCWFVLAVISFAIIFVRLQNGGVGINAIINWSGLILLSYVAFKYDENNFVSRYVSIVAFIAVTSLLIFGICLVNQELYKSITLLNAEYKDSGHIYYGMLLYVFRSQEVGRNNGIFNEPGLYQMVLNSALYFLIFCQGKLNFSRKNKNQILVLFIVTIITTQSTTGYIGLLFIIFSFLCEKNSLYKKKVVQIAIVGAVTILLNYYIMGENSIIVTYVFNKITEISQSTTQHMTSGGARMASIYVAFEAIKSNPFGCGYDVLESLKRSLGYVSTYTSYSTATGAFLISYIAIIGVIPALIIYGHFLYEGYKNRKSIISFIVVVFLFVNTTLAQSNVFYPALLILFFANSKCDNFTALKE